MRPINKIVVHCSASPHEVGGKEVDAQMIKEWHLKRGWSDIGYHCVITKDGTIQQGRPESEQGAHAKGHNKDSLGICVVGDDCFTVAQMVSLKAMLKKWQTQYHINESNVYCHYQLNPDKSCPNLDISDLKQLMFRE